MMEELCFTYGKISQPNYVMILHPFAESFFYRNQPFSKRSSFNCSYNPGKSNIGKHLDIISRSLVTLFTKYENILLGDCSACVDKEALNTFYKSYSLQSLIKQLTCFKNPENSSCMDLILTN